jgi:hypothetical protein
VIFEEVKLRAYSPDTCLQLSTPRQIQSGEGDLSFGKIPKPRGQPSQPTCCSSHHYKHHSLQSTGYFQGSYIELRYCTSHLDSLCTKGVDCPWQSRDRYRRIYGKQFINFHDQNCKIYKLTGERHFDGRDLLEH